MKAQQKSKDKTPIKPKVKLKSKSDAIIINCSGENSYAEILRQVKGDPLLKDVGDDIRSIRRTQKGELLLELKRDSTLSSFSCKRRVEESLKDKATVRALTQEALIECRDLDEMTTKTSEMRCMLNTMST